METLRTTSTSYVTNWPSTRCGRGCATKSRKAKAAAEGPIALLSQQSKDKEEKRKRRGLTNVTCYGCGKKGHLKHEKEKGKGKGTGQSEASDKNTGQAGALKTSKTALLANKKLTNYYHFDWGASDHLVPSTGELRA
jgi:hypothetical protein